MSAVGGAERVAKNGTKRALIWEGWVLGEVVRVQDEVVACGGEGGGVLGFGSYC